MIVRINQLDAQHAEAQSGWPADDLNGPVQCAWPAETLAFELLILPADEQNQPLTRTFRQSQLRQLIPDIVAAMRRDNHEIVVRLDGPLAVGEMIDAFKHLTDARGMGRYCTSATDKFTDDAHPPTQSIRIYLSLDRLAALCADPNVGLDRSVRMRIYCIDDQLVNPLLDITDCGDERWSHIFSDASLAVSTSRSLQSVQVFTRLFTPEETRLRLTERLMGAMRTA